MACPNAVLDKHQGAPRADLMMFAKVDTSCLGTLLGSQTAEMAPGARRSVQEPLA